MLIRVLIRVQNVPRVQDAPFAHGDPQQAKQAMFSRSQGGACELRRMQVPWLPQERLQPS